MANKNPLNFARREITVMKTLVRFVAITLTLGFLAASASADDAKFDLIQTVHDHGAQVSKVVIDGNTKINGESLALDSFRVVTDNSLEDMYVLNGEIPVVEAYVSDSAEGSKTDAGSYVVLYLKNGLDSGAANVLQWDNGLFMNRVLDLNYIVTQEKELLTSDDAPFKYASLTQGGIINREVEAFGAGGSNGLNYRYYRPNEPGGAGRHPLIVYFHGGGEGGDSNVSHLLSERTALSFATEENQEKFDYPYVLAPQCPTFWVQEFRLGFITLKGQDYTKDVAALIREFIAARDDIDTSRVYVGGHSMGGWQTWAVAAESPSLFAAMFPLSTARDIPDNILREVKDIPNWISHVESDILTSVEFSRSAYSRLRDMGGAPVYVELDMVEVNDIRYNPHAIWVAASNNAIVNDRGIRILDWLAKQVKR